MRKNIFTILVLLAVLIFLPNVALAHPGRLDSSGGHTCRTNCPFWGLEYEEYHYHDSDGGYTNSTGQRFDKYGVPRKSDIDFDDEVGAYAVNNANIRGAYDNSVLSIAKKGDYFKGELRSDGYFYLNYNGKLAKIHASLVTTFLPETKIINKAARISDYKGNFIETKYAGYKIYAVQIGDYYRFAENGQVKFVYKSNAQDVENIVLNGRDSYIINNGVNIRNAKDNSVIATAKKGDYFKGELRSDGYHYINYKGILAKIYKSNVLQASPKTLTVTTQVNVRNSDNLVVGVKKKGDKILAVKIGKYYRFYDNGVKFIYHTFAK